MVSSCHPAALGTNPVADGNFRFGISFLILLSVQVASTFFSCIHECLLLLCEFVFVVGYSWFIQCACSVTRRMEWRVYKQDATAGRVSRCSRVDKCASVLRCFAFRSFSFCPSVLVSFWYKFYNKLHLRFFQSNRTCSRHHVYIGIYVTLGLFAEAKYVRLLCLVNVYLCMCPRVTLCLFHLAICIHVYVTTRFLINWMWN